MTRLIVSVYVNDILIFGPRRSIDIAVLKKALNNTYKMTDLGLCSQYLGIEIVRNRTNRTVRITQSTYIKKILVRFKMADYTSVATLIVANIEFHKESIRVAIITDTHKY